MPLLRFPKPAVDNTWRGGGTDGEILLGGGHTWPRVHTSVSSICRHSGRESHTHTLVPVHTPTPTHSLQHTQTVLWSDRWHGAATAGHSEPRSPPATVVP